VLPAPEQGDGGRTRRRRRPGLLRSGEPRHGRRS
jgi:hypothetical protein